MKIAINGLGRIGRAAFKLLLQAPEVQIVAVNDVVAPDQLAYLLNYDTVYGRYQTKVTAKSNALVVGSYRCGVLSERDPAKLPWKDLGIDLVLECTGHFNRRADLMKHLHAGAKRVMLSAPAKDDDVPTVIYGVNLYHEGLGPIFSCASCTTNCVAPVLEVIGRHVGVHKAVMTTTHAYTASQSIVDGPNKKKRRGRAGAENLVPSTTGAAVATARALPEYLGKFDGTAVRAPVPAGSVADIVMVTARDTDVEEVNGIFLLEARSDRYAGILGIAEDPIVSSDIIQDPRASIIDPELTQVVDGNLVKVTSWYDNEWGYANQLVRQTLRMVTDVRVAAGTA